MIPTMAQIVRRHRHEQSSLIQDEAAILLGMMFRVLTEDNRSDLKEREHPAVENHFLCHLCQENCIST
jgi:hypothetical protein